MNDLAGWSMNENFVSARGPHSSGPCPHCGVPGMPFDHPVWESVAMMLAQPLRDALTRHLDEHGCGTDDFNDPRYVSGFLHCEDAKRLWDLLPMWDRALRA